MFQRLLHAVYSVLFLLGINSSALAQQNRTADYHQIPESFKNHPEYGVLRLEENPNAIELIHLRTKNSRVFADLSTGVNYSVNTGGTFHFKDSKNRWISIQDMISKSNQNEYGIFQSELPIKINYQTGKTEMILVKNGKSMVFGENSSLQYVGENGVIIENYKSNNSMGEPAISENQLILKDFLPGINRAQVTEYWSVRTDYFIEQKLNIPSNAKFLQISDEINIPSSWKIEFGEGEMTPAGWNGDLLILNEKGNVVSKISRPLYYDSFKSEKKNDISSHLGVGTYQITKNATGYNVKLLVPASWFNQTNLVYPLIIDPTSTNTYAGNYGLYELSGFNAACQADMNLNFPPTGGYQVTGTNTTYRVWAKGYIFSSGGTDSYADKAEQRTRVGSLNGYSATQSGSGTNHGSTNPSFFTSANNGQDYSMSNLTIANGCYVDRPTIPYQWQGYQTFFPQAGPPAANQLGCSMGYQELVTNTWVVTATYNVVAVVTPTTISYGATPICAASTSAPIVQTGTTGGIYSFAPAGLSINLTNGAVNPASSTPGTYTVTYNVGTAPCNSTSTAVLSIVNSVTPTFTQVPVVCSGATFTLPSSSTNATPITGTWSPAINNTVTTTYTFTPDPGQCASTATMTVTVGSAATLNVGSNSPICSGDAINLTNAITGTVTYSWTGPNGFTSSVQNPTIPNATAAASGTYSLVVTGGGCTSPPATVNVVVNQTPTVAVVKTDILCNGTSTGTATATATPTGTYTYAWSPSGGTAAAATNLTAGTYIVTVGSGSCTATGSVTITEPTIVALTTSTTVSTCGTPNGSATVVATGGIAPYTYSWSPSGGTASTATGILAGSYTATVTDVNGCVKTAVANVVTLNGPALTIGSLTNVTCNGNANGAATIAVTGGTAPYTFAWTPSGGTAASATNLGVGTYSVSVTDFSGCNSSINVVITENPAMNISNSATNATCGLMNGTATAIATGGNGVYTYVWTPGNLSGATATNLPPGSYSVTVTDGNGCSITGTSNVGLTGTIPVDVTPPTTTIDPGQGVNLFAASSLVIPGISYTWSPTVGLSCTDCPNPIATPTVTTTYYATLTSPDGCMGTDSSKIFVRIICGEHFIPTIFSPNGDGSNDEFRIFGECIVAMDLKIYDRWGEVVFESTNPQDTWDGTYKGQMMNSASFIYSVNLSFIDGRFIKEKGSINLVR